MNNSTSESMLSPKQVAAQIRYIRSDWDIAGINKAIGKACESYPIGIVREAALAAARDPQVRTPGVIDARCQHIREQQKRNRDDAGAAAALPSTRWPADLPANHCGNPSCSCPHGECFAGWLGDAAERPCAECRPGLSARWIAAHEKSRTTTEQPLTSQVGNHVADIKAALAARRAQNHPIEKGETA